MKLDRAPAVTAVIMSDISGLVKELGSTVSEGSGAVLESAEDE